MRIFRMTFTALLTALLLAAPLAVTAPPAQSHEATQGPLKGPLGGQVVDAPPYHLELLLADGKLTLQVLDDDLKPLDAAGATATATLLVGAAPTRLTLTPAGGGTLTGSPTVALDGKVTAAVVLTMPGQKPVQARFEMDGKGHDHDHGHGHGHSHGHGHDHEAAGVDIGRPAPAATATRTVQVTMGDALFTPAAIDVAPGETVRFVVANSGDLLHEFSIATPDQHLAHRPEMLALVDRGVLTATGIDHAKLHGPDGAHAHDHPNSVLVEPGRTAELTWTFPVAGTLEFACNVPGHYEAGMVGRFVLASAHAH